MTELSNGKSQADLAHSAAMDAYGIAQGAMRVAKRAQWIAVGAVVLNVVVVIWLWLGR